MESTRQKIFTQLRTQLSVAAILAFVLLMCPALVISSQLKIVWGTDSGTIKFINKGKTGILRLDCKDAPETSKMKNVVAGPFCLICTTKITDLASNKSVEKNVEAMIDMAEFSALFIPTERNLYFFQNLCS